MSHPADRQVSSVERVPLVGKQYYNLRVRKLIDVSTLASILRYLPTAALHSNLHDAIP
jgi:hypothetical protein